MQQCGKIGNCWTLSETRLMLVLSSWNLDWHLYEYNTIVYGKTLQKVMGNPSSRQLQTPGKAEKKSLGNTVKRSQMMPPVHWLSAWYFLRGCIEQRSLCSAQCYGLPFVVRDFICYSWEQTFDIWQVICTFKGKHRANMNVTEPQASFFHLLSNYTDTNLNSPWYASLQPKVQRVKAKAKVRCGTWTGWLFSMCFSCHEKGGICLYIYIYEYVI